MCAEGNLQLVQTPVFQNVYIPGDNDIGGEGADFRTKFKISRFERHFENLTGVVNVHFIDFIKVSSYCLSFKLTELSAYLSL